jgi:uncharacterized membrane protein
MDAFKRIQAIKDKLHAIAEKHFCEEARTEIYISFSYLDKALKIECDRRLRQRFTQKRHAKPKRN